MYSIAHIKVHICDVFLNFIFSVDSQLKYAKTQLDKLKKTNVFNATFHIW